MKVSLLLFFFIRSLFPSVKKVLEVYVVPVIQELLLLIALSQIY